VPALRAGTDHELDSPEWLSVPLVALVPRDLAGITTTTAQQAFTVSAHTFILIPRLARYVRALRNSPSTARGSGMESEAITLAQHLLASKLDANLLDQALAAGELQCEQTIIPEMAAVVPISYRINSLLLSMLLLSYWTCRLHVCGLIDALVEATPSAPRFLDTAALREEDADLASKALMCVQQTMQIVTATELSAADRVRHRGEALRLVLLLEGAFGAWSRQERTAQTADGAQYAAEMKHLCLDELNTLLSALQIPTMSLADTEAVLDLFTGGSTLWQPLAE
jgi:hypothetical protein